MSMERGHGVWRPSRRALGAGLGMTLAAGCTAQARSDGELIAMPGAKYPLKLNPGERYPVDANGKPFFLNGDTAWSLVAGLRREDADIYLRDRAARGFNAVMTYVLCRYHAKNAPANIYGELPFRNMVDFVTPNDAYFAQLDWVVARAGELGILMILAPSWLGANGELGGFYQEMKAAGPDAMRTYGRFLGNRYRTANNILWLMGGDHNPPDKQLVRSMAEGIREGGSMGLRTAHCTAFWSPVDVWEGEDWLELDNLYSYGSLWEAAMKEYVRPQIKPYFMAEALYENSIKEGIAEKRVRRQAYESVLCGAFGHVFGSSPIWHMNAPGAEGREFPDWRPYLDTPGSRGMKVMRDLMTSVAWWKLEPDTDARLLVSPGADKAVAAIDKDRRLAICFLPGPAPVRVRMSFFPNGRRVVAEWRNPADGRAQPADQSARSGAVVTFTPPVRAGTDDWLLVLRSRA